MTRRLLATFLLVLLLAAAAPTAAGAAPSAAPAKVRLVVVVLAPFIGWDDLVSGHMPYVQDLIAESALGDMNVTSLVRDVGSPTAENGALMLSACTWTRFDDAAPGAREQSGTPAIVYDGFSRQVEAQRGTRVLARPGALGQAIEDAGGVTAAIGAAVPVVAAAGPGAVRPAPEAGVVSPAVLAAMDASGTVALGSISPSLVRPSAEAAYGIVSDPAAIAKEFGTVVADPRVRRGPALVVIDPGDLRRADAASVYVSGGVESLARTHALRALDETVRQVTGRMPDGALLVIAAPAATRETDGPSGYGPVVVNGSGWRGLLNSPSTRRQGLVTSADLSATVLDSLGIEAPPQSIGTPVLPDDTPHGEARRVSLLRGMDATSRAVDDVRPGLVNAYIVVAVLCLGLAVALLALPKVPRRAAAAAQVLLMCVLSVPAANVLMFLPVRFPATPVTVVTLLAATTMLVWILAVSSHYRLHLAHGTSFLAAFTAAVLLLDQWTGASLSFSAVLGYSPLVGARFYGIGNEAAALLVGAGVTGLAILLDHRATRPWIAPVRRAAMPALAAACLITAAGPALGANIGVAVWGTFTFVLAGAAALGRRIGWKTVLVAALAVVLVVGAFTAVDLLAPPSARTHLGKTVSSAGEGGAFATMIARKAATNVAILTHSSWSLLFLGIVVVLGWLAFRPTGAMRDVLLAHPAFAGALTACLLGGAIAYFTEDSGIVVPALLLLFPTAALLDLMLAFKTEGRAW